MLHELRGVGVAMVTPFNDDNSVNYGELEILTNHLTEGGIDYLVVQGTTAETPAFSDEEKAEVLEAIKNFNAGRLPIVLGHGGNNTKALIDGLNKFDLSGVTAILSASPYYNKPNQEGIFQHYKAFAAQCPIPIIVYNVPGRTASNISVDTQVRLAEEIENIVAVKEASGDIEQKSEVIRRSPEDFIVTSGDDAQVLAEMALGNDGVISVIANAFPMQFSTMVKAGLSGDFESARKIHHDMMPFINLIFADGNPGGIKALLKMMGICNDHVRLPLVKINAELYKQLETQLNEYLG